MPCACTDHRASAVTDGKTATPSLSFARLLHRYTRLFAQSDAAEALQYLYLICLYADLKGPLGEEQVALAHQYVRELVMETRQYSQLLGDVRNDGTKVVGLGFRLPSFRLSAALTSPVSPPSLARSNAT